MNYKHGMANTRVYSVWASMKSRCENTNDPAYFNYGGRGITISERWKKFPAFFSDMGHPPCGLSIERKDNNKGYSAENCEWATRTTQNRNRRGLFLVTIGGETKPFSAWVDHYGVVSYSAARQRVTLGWTPEDAAKTPRVSNRLGIPRGNKVAEFSHVTVETKNGPIPLWQAIETSGLRSSTISKRLQRGWSMADALSLSPHKGLRPKVRAA